MAATKPPTSAVRAYSPSPIVPQNVAELLAMADLFFRAGMCPRGCNRPEAVAAVIAYGLEIGIKPAAAVNCIHLTNGKATVWGDMPLGLVQASGQLKTRKEWIDGEGENRTAHSTLERINDVEGPVTFTYSVWQARKMNLFMKGGKEGPWDKDTDNMLLRRARGRGLVSKFADVLNGLLIGEDTDYEVAPTGEKAEVQVRTEESPQSATATNREPPTDVHGEVMIDDAQLAEVKRLAKTWMTVNAASGEGDDKIKLEIWKAFLLKKWNVESATKLTGSQADELLTILRETAATPTAALFAPAADRASHPAEQQQPAQQQQQQPTPTAA